MVSVTRAEAKEAFNHVLDTVIDRGDSSSLKSSLIENGITDIFDLFTIMDDFIDSLTYKDPNDNLFYPVKKGDKMLLQCFLAYQQSFEPVTGNVDYKANTQSMLLQYNNFVDNVEKEHMSILHITNNQFVVLILLIFNSKQIDNTLVCLTLSYMGRVIYKVVSFVDKSIPDDTTVGLRARLRTITATDHVSGSDLFIRGFLPSNDLVSVPPVHSKRLVLFFLLLTRGMDLSISYNFVLVPAKDMT
jgi:hypothetical protein